jgi:hypothetical protein
MLMLCRLLDFIVVPVGFSLFVSEDHPLSKDKAFALGDQEGLRGW